MRSKDERGCVLNFSPPKGHHKGTSDNPILGQLGRYSVGDGLVVSTFLSTHEEKEVLRKALIDENPELHDFTVIDPGVLELWRGDKLVAICEIKGSLNNDDGLGFGTCDRVQGGVFADLTYALPDEDPGAIARKFVMTLCILLHQSMRSLFDQCDRVGQVYLDFVVNTRTRQGKALAEVLFESVDEFADEVRSDGKRKCHCFLSIMSRLK